MVQKLSEFSTQQLREKLTQTLGQALSEQELSSRSDRFIQKSRRLCMQGGFHPYREDPRQESSNSENI